MTWQEVKDFLDHIRTTCMDERQALKLEVRQLRGDVELLKSLLNGLGFDVLEGDFTRSDGSTHRYAVRDHFYADPKNQEPADGPPVRRR